ncbi:nucleotide exchange factor GrpE [Haloglycomyces albus]|uniref:nucleotide exchange factor GrpE n=1 Tax=Haloglycomyces albus TaxID=526067 RepID=UPI00046D4BCA|nr:nucleotide exchange factor GrpE [Haloglycomyces albus]
MSDERKDEPNSEAADGEGTESQAEESAADSTPDESAAAEKASTDKSGESEETDEDGLTVDDILAAADNADAAADDSMKVLERTVEERTADVRRITAEFQNYRKRVERDKSRAAELAVSNLLNTLLPVLDDLDRAREHGDLTGPFAAVADSLTSALEKQGLESFGEKGDEFDPTIHEAVAHMEDATVDGPTCIDVMRRGYRMGERLIRPAMVAVAEPPEGSANDEADRESGSDDESK